MFSRVDETLLAQIRFKLKSNCIGIELFTARKEYFAKQT